MNKCFFLFVIILAAFLLISPELCPAQSETISISYPAGGETWTYGEKHTIRWETDITGDVDIDYSLDGGSTWIGIASGTPAGTLEYQWEVPDAGSQVCTIRVSNNGDPRVSGKSGTFTMQEFIVDEVVFHERNEEIEYHWVSFVPETVKKNKHTYIIVEGLTADINGGPVTSYEDLTANIIKTTGNKSALVKNQGYILIVPVIPSNRISPLYMDNDSFNATDSFYRRADLKVLQMIDKLLYILRKEGYDVDDKIFLEGFSAGGIFAQRFPILHPTRVQATGVGHAGGFLMHPESFYNSVELNWPIGTNDFEEVVGYEFDRETYKNVPHYVFIGSEDTDVDGLWKPEYIDFLKSNFGLTAHENIENQSNYFKAQGYNYTFEIYPGLGHTHHFYMRQGAYEFFETHRVRTSPTFFPIDVQIAKEGKKKSVYFRTSYNTNYTISYSTGELPEGASFSAENFTLSFQPGYDQAGTHYVDIIATISGEPPLSDTLHVEIVVNNIIRPPENLSMGGIRTDSGNAVHIQWDGSPDEEYGDVDFYRIYRSRSATLTDPIPIAESPSPDSLIAWEEHYTILIDSVAAGTVEYIDENLPVDNVSYYYWVQTMFADDASGLEPAGEIISDVDELPIEFYVNNPFPNPFNPATTIEYSLPQDGQINLSIYNISGQSVSVLKDELQHAGNHSIIWNASEFPSGIYFCILKANGFTQTRKMVLVK